MISRRLLLAVAAGSPASAALSSAALAAGPLPQVVTCEMHMGRGNTPWTPVSIAGQGPFRFLLDSGAHVSGMDESLGQQLGLKSLNKVEIGGVVGSREVDVFLATDVIIGNGFRQKEMALLGLGNLGAYNGLLAAGVLTAFDTEIDVLAGTLKLFPNGLADRPGAQRIAGTYDSGGKEVSKRLLLRVTVDGKPVRVVVDTGAPPTLVLSSHFAQSSGLWSKKTRYQESKGGGLSGRFTGRDVRVDLGLGSGLAVPGVIATMISPDSPRREGAGDGFLGMELLRRFTFGFEAKAPALWLKPNASLNEPFPYDRSGMSCEFGPDRQVRVFAVQPESPAARAGIVVGDTLPDFSDQTSYGRVGDKVTLDVVHNGETRSVTLVLEELL